MTLTKADLISSIYTNHPSLSQNEARAAVESFLQISKNVMINGEGLLVSGFGKFNINDKRKRRGRNPFTGDDLIIDARRVITFKPSSNLRKRINATGETTKEGC